MLFGYRKLIACAASIALATGLLALHLIDGSNWVMFSTFSIGFFCAANAAAKFGPPSPPQA